MSLPVPPEPPQAAVLPDGQHRPAGVSSRTRPHIAQPGKPGQPAGAAQLRPRLRAIGQVVVVEAAGRRSDGVEDLDLGIQMALAEGPRGVICDLSTMLGQAEPGVVEVLAAAGRHVREWPGIPVGVACPDPRVRAALRAHPLGANLIVTPSLFSAISAVQATAAPTVQWLSLAPHPAGPRICRNFVTRTLLDWQLGRAIPFATLVISELVASSTAHAGAEIDVSVAWDCGALRLTVRDPGRALAGQWPCALDLHGRRLSVVAGLSRAFGVLPTADGAKVAWAVLDAPRPRPSSRRKRSVEGVPGANRRFATAGRASVDGGAVQVD